MSNKIIPALKIIGLASVVALEIFCAKLAYETLGEVTSGAYLFILILNIIPLILLVLKKRILAIFLLLAIAMAIVPYQLYLGHRLLALKEEAANVTAYLYNYKEQNQQFPDDINGYAFKKPALKGFFSYNKEQGDNFYLQYYVGTSGTSHYLKSETGQWDYYPD